MKFGTLTTDSRKGKCEMPYEIDLRSNWDYDCRVRLKLKKETIYLWKEKRMGWIGL
uniref:Uncharacterized protein n=1 Tax=Lotus japonicus TaxID=34305 RepID=I3SR64_LOTJA|nr:unknown [Lotus japonicus]